MSDDALLDMLAGELREVKQRLNELYLAEYPAYGLVASYTPTWTATSSNPSLGDGTLTGRYVQVGQLVVFEIQMVAGSTTTFGTGNWEFALPVAMTTDFSEGWGSCAMTDLNTAIYLGHTRLLPSTTRCRALYTASGGITALNVGPTAPFAWANGDFITLNGSYVAA